MTRRAAVLLVLLLGSVLGLQAVHERRSGPPGGTAESLLYVRSPEAMKRMALSYHSLLADVYWIRAVQHYGGTRLSTDPTKQYDLLYPLLDITTSLDPHFRIAYLFGSVFLAEEPPGGPGRSDLAVALLQKGLRAQPDKWEYAQAIGFVHYWWDQDYMQAAAWFRRAAEMPNAPNWMAPLAAVTLAQGGNRASSRRLWQEVLNNAEADWLRVQARFRLRQLDAMDQITALEALIEEYARRVGTRPRTWADVVQAGFLPGVPLDPDRFPYQLDPASGAVTLDRKSTINPLPIESSRRR
ncbi:MAG: hypothetical protein HYY76_01530 [Acidobacteria bacterium]|nr:hypothetical protein [Acidobacteriota bacterium]